MELVVTNTEGLSLSLIINTATTLDDNLVNANTDSLSQWAVQQISKDVTWTNKLQLKDQRQCNKKQAQEATVCNPITTLILSY